LCDSAAFTGYQIDGGFADHVVADSRYCFELDPSYDDAHAAPLLCAGLIGYRSLVMTDNAKRLGIYGFGAAAHIITQVAVYQNRDIYAFTRPGDTGAQAFAKRLNAIWAGDSNQQPDVPLDAAIIFAPVGALIPQALRAIRKGGIVVCGGIHMSDIPRFPYRTLWGERQIRSVANLTRRDAQEFLALAPHVPINVEVEPFDLTEANAALSRLRTGQLHGAAVLIAT
jgi:propanol-preferring alcohol dehydrogenase